MERLERRGHHMARRPGGSALAAVAAVAPRRTHPSRSLREQLTRAARVQRSLLPDVSVPVGQFQLATLYWPCETLGGDFYDLVRRPDCAVLLVADVMGHGPEAALITMLVKAAFHESVADSGDPAALLEEMSARLRRLIPESVLVAATVARLDPNDSSLRLANAGLPHPYVLRASERRVDEVLADGFPLGFIDGYRQRADGVCLLHLAPGDVLVLASDGIGSIESVHGQNFEECRLRLALEGLAGHDGREVIDGLAAEAVEFGQGRRFPDDINLVAVSRRAPGTSAFDG